MAVTACGPGYPVISSEGGFKQAIFCQLLVGHAGFEFVGHTDSVPMLVDWGFTYSLRLD